MFCEHSIYTKCFLNLLISLVILICSSSCELHRYIKNSPKERSSTMAWLLWDLKKCWILKLEGCQRLKIKLLLEIQGWSLVGGEQTCYFFLKAHHVYYLNFSIISFWPFTQYWVVGSLGSRSRVMVTFLKKSEKIIGRLLSFCHGNYLQMCYPFNFHTIP